MHSKTIFTCSLVPLFILSGCASLSKKDLTPPKDVMSRTKIVEIPKEKQSESKEIKVIKAIEGPAKEKRKQKEEIKIVNNPFKVGETIKLDLYYIGLKAATLTVEVKPFVEMNGKKAFHFNGIAKTSALMDLIYKVYDVIDCYVDYEKFVPLTMTLKMDESKQNVSMILNYDHEKQKSHFWKKRIDAKGEVTEINREDDFTRYAQDIFSSLYYVRTHDLKLGDKVKFVIHDNGKNWNMTIDVVGEEKIWTRLGSIDTIVLHPTVEREGEKFTKGSMTLWITNDDKRIPVKFEAQVRIGSMKGIIKDYIVPREE